MRDPQKAVELVTPGVSLRQGSYDDPASLVAAFQGVSTVLLISGTDLATRTATLLTRLARRAQPA